MTWRTERSSAPEAESEVVAVMRRASHRDPLAPIGAVRERAWKTHMAHFGNAPMWGDLATAMLRV